MYIITLLEAAGCLGYVYPSHLSHSGRLIIPLQTDIYSKWVCDSPTPNLAFGLVFKVHLLTDSDMLYPYNVPIDQSPFHIHYSILYKYMCRCQ